MFHYTSCKSARARHLSLRRSAATAAIFLHPNQIAAVAALLRNDKL